MQSEAQEKVQVVVVCERGNRRNVKQEEREE